MLIFNLMKVYFKIKIKNNKKVPEIIENLLILLFIIKIIVVLKMKKMLIMK